MQFKSSLLGLAIVLVVSVGSAHAVDNPASNENAAGNRFAALEGIAAEAMTTRELESVVGGTHDGFPQLMIPIGKPGQPFNMPHIDDNACAGLVGLAGLLSTGSC